MMKGNKKRLKNNAETRGERKDAGGTQRRRGNAETRGKRKDAEETRRRGGNAETRREVIQKMVIFNITLKPANCEISNLSVKPDTTQGHSRYSYCDLS